MSPCTPRMMTAPKPTMLGFVDVPADLLTDDKWVTVALVTGTIKLPCTCLKVQQQLFCRFAEVSVTASCGTKDLFFGGDNMALAQGRGTDPKASPSAVVSQRMSLQQMSGAASGGFHQNAIQQTNHLEVYPQTRSPTSSSC